MGAGDRDSGPHVPCLDGAGAVGPYTMMSNASWEMAKWDPLYTDTTENITFPQLRCRAVINAKQGDDPIKLTVLSWLGKLTYWYAYKQVYC